MTSSIIAHSLNGVTIGQRTDNGFINVTELSRVHKLETGERKDPSDWLRLKSTQSALQKLSDVTGIPVTSLFNVVQGKGKEQGTWIHPRLAVRFTMWLNDDFSLQVEDWVHQWIKEAHNPIVQPQQPTHQWLWHTRMAQFVNSNKIPNGYWCVYLELTKMVALMEGQGVVLNDCAVPDISVGLCWSKYLKDAGIDSEHKFYPHSYPDNRNSQPARIYPYKLLGIFHEWLEGIYLVEKFPNYIRNRCELNDCQKVSMLFGITIKPKQIRAAKD